jgi:uncharacterized protein
MDDSSGAPSTPLSVGMMARPLSAVRPELEPLVTGGATRTPSLSSQSEIRRETVWVRMRDGVRLATDLYLPPGVPAPTIAMRTPYGKAHPKFTEMLLAFSQRGYVVVSQDCRGTGESEPESWDYYVYETEDGVDCVEWIAQQPWYDGFIAGVGSSYIAQTQWCMAAHPRMSTIVPEVSGLGLAVNTARYYMFLNAHSRSVGKGKDKVSVSYDEMERRMLPETLSAGFFNEPLHHPFSEALIARYPQLNVLPRQVAERWLWEHYCALPSAGRAEIIKLALGVSYITTNDIEALSRVFGNRHGHDAHTMPCVRPAEVCGSLHGPALMITGWYDWALNDALATWNVLVSASSAQVGVRSRLIITPSAHNVPGYHEAQESHPELQHNHRMPSHIDLLLAWYAAVREGRVDMWPRVIYYLMGANRWYAASAWPPPESRPLSLYLRRERELSQAPDPHYATDQYIYDPNEPTPTAGGSIVSYVYSPGSVDVSAVHEREDVLTYTTAPLDEPLDVVGPLALILFASSDALDTDFVARLSDVFPDGRAIQIQSGMLRTRYRSGDGIPELLERGRIYRLEIDMWSTANRFMRGHRLRLDISSSDFPRFDRNANRGGQPGEPVASRQTVFYGGEYPSQLCLSVLGPEQ